jgi:hypothetical protein
MSKARLEKVENVTVLTVYDQKEAKSYLMSDWEKFGDKAHVIKHIKYDRPPLVKMGDITPKVKSIGEN